jgi:glutamyl-tRNA synthetase
LNAGHDLDAPGVSWRLRTPSDLTLRYVVVRQKEGTPAYNLASVVDDVDFGITHIVRGSDLEPATEVQRHLATLAPGLAPFNLIHITHHPLITGADGQKLSKGQGAMGLRRLVDAGLTRELVFAEAARLMWLTAGELQGFVS